MLWRISDFAGPPLQQANALFLMLWEWFLIFHFMHFGVFLAEFFLNKIIV
jgi:hypothetical protein